MTNSSQHVLHTRYCTALPAEAMVFIPPLAEVPDQQANYNNKDSSGDDAHQQCCYINFWLGFTLTYEYSGK